MADDYFGRTVTADERLMIDHNLRDLVRGTAGIFLTTNDAVHRWNRNISLPSQHRVFCIPYFLPGAPRSCDVRPVTKAGGLIEILFVGREARRKNLPALISAIDRLRCNASVRLTVVSDLRDGHVDLGRDYIVHYNALSNQDVLALMERSHIFAMVSHRESFGMVFVEALAKGCAILAPRRTAQRDMLGDTATFAEPNDIDSVCQSLDDLLATATWSLRHQRSQERYIERFAPDVVADAFFDALEQVCASH